MIDRFPSIGIPGRIARFQVGMNAYGEGGDGTQLNTDRKDFHVYGNIEPMSQVKNKWVSGLLFEYGAWFCNSDNRAVANGCNRLRVRDNGRGKQTDACSTPAPTRSETVWLSSMVQVWCGTSVRTRCGRCAYGRLTRIGVPASAATSNGKGQKKGSVFLIGHDLYLVESERLVDWFVDDDGIDPGGHPLRADRCVGGCNGSTGYLAPATSIVVTSTGIRILLREWDLWYFIAPRMSVGGSVLWYDASNLRNVWQPRSA